MGLYTDKQQREVFHFLFLEKLLKISDPFLYSLKGGVNLRFFFNSPRYSEDMDLDVFGSSVATLKKNGYKILNDAAFMRTLSSYGIEDIKISDPSKAKHTATTQRFRLNLINSNGESFPTKVEFSRRVDSDKERIAQELIRPELARIYKRLSYVAPHYDSQSAVVQKIRALGGRTEVQARDAFDLYILYQAGYLKREEIGVTATRGEREKALTALHNISLESYQAQVVEFLELEAQEQYGKSKTWDTICNVIEGVLL